MGQPISLRHLDAAQQWAREQGIKEAQVSVPALGDRVKAGFKAAAAHFDAENDVRALRINDPGTGASYLVNVSFYAKDNNGWNQYLTNDFAKATTIIGAIPGIGTLAQGMYGLMSTLVGLNALTAQLLGIDPGEDRGAILLKSGLKNSAAVAASVAAYVTLGPVGIAADIALRTVVGVMDERDQARLSNADPVSVVQVSSRPAR